MLPRPPQNPREWLSFYQPSQVLLVSTLERIEYLARIVGGGKLFGGDILRPSCWLLCVSSFFSRTSFFMSQS